MLKYGIVILLCVSANAHTAIMLDESHDRLICEGNGKRVMLNQDGITWSRDQGKYGNPLIQIGEVNVDYECKYALTGKY